MTIQRYQLTAEPDSFHVPDDNGEFVMFDEIQRFDSVFSDKIESIDEDPECAHISADEMLCELLTILGCVKTVESFN